MASATIMEFNPIHPKKSKGGETISSNDVSDLLEKMEKKLHLKLEETKTDLLTWKEEQLQAHRTGIMKIPKKIRQMTVAEFNQTYNCNILDLLLKGFHTTATTNNNNNQQKKNTIPPPMCGKRDRMGMMETPAPYRGNRPMRTPATAVRTVRRGEML